MARSRGRRTAGLGTSVALRTFILFCVCAAVPVLGFGIFSYHFAERLVRSQATERLQDLSKSYGLLLNERLAQADSVLLEIAQATLRRPEDSLSDIDTQGARVRIISARVMPIPVVEPAGVRADATPAATSDKALPDTALLWRHLRLTSDGSHVQVLLTAHLVADGHSAEVVGEILPSYLWDADSVIVPGGRQCVYANGKIVYCSAPQLQAHSIESAQWDLYLKPRYESATWQVVVEQDTAVAFAALNSFKATVPLGVVVTIAIALLLSSVQIRRSHKPLAVLTEAVGRLSRGSFRKPVEIQGRDEFANLSRAFNRMAGSIRRQFRILATLSGIDRQILALPAAEPIITTVLPQIRRVLSGDVAAVLVVGAGTASRQYVCLRATGDKLESCDVVSEPERLSALGACDSRSVTGEELTSLGLRMEGRVEASWRLATICVENVVRGVVVVGYTERKGRRKGLNELGGLARRIAVAIGNEDRERALLRQAYYDGLTELPNRQLFRDRLEQELVRAAQVSTQVAVLFIDLDHFKTVNDSLGHSAGDKALVGAAQRLRTLVPEGATLARLGGDEFTVVIPMAQMQSIAHFASDIHRALDTPYVIAGTHVPIQASVGIAMFPQDGDNAEDLLRNADTAMYRAKAQGRGKAVFFEDSMNLQANRRFRLLQRLRDALDRQLLHLVFQPKVDAMSGSLVGVEALARWTDAEDGAISPTEFIPLAEECGLIDELGDWALREACATLQRWDNSGIDVPHVAVNVSMHQIRDEQFVARVAGILRLFKVEPGRLEIEITESSVGTDMNKAIGLLRTLSNIGVRIAIDDFGTGYSSMTSLAELPADVVKIDRAFVMNCDVDPKGAALLRGMIGMAHALGKQVVAEGVETEAQAQLLRGERCEVLQGFLISKGVSAQGLAKFATGLVESRSTLMSKSA
ncbi:MAG: EAL domain-containing protein [Pseudomonadota bacterium]